MEPYQTALNFIGKLYHWQAAVNNDARVGAVQLKRAPLLRHASVSVPPANTDARGREVASWKVSVMRNATEVNWKSPCTTNGLSLAMRSVGKAKGSTKTG